MMDPTDFRIGPHAVSVRMVAGRWTATVDGRLMAGFFGSEAQAAGAALLAISGLERDLATLGTGDTVALWPVVQQSTDPEL
mgnify:CR=1 FL=1